MRVVVLAAILSPKIDLKLKIYAAIFEGENPDFEVYIDCAKVFIDDLIKN